LPKKSIDALFDSMDPDGSGAINYSELQTILKQRKKPARGAVQEAQTSVPLWTGSLLSRKAVVIVFGPATYDKATFARRLAHRFGGTYLDTSQLAQAEITANSGLGVQIATLLAGGGAISQAMALTLLEGAAASLRGPFFLQDFPRTMAQVPALEAAFGAPTAAIELRVPGHADLSLQPLVSHYNERQKLISLQGRSDALKMLQQVEDWLVARKDAMSIKKAEAEQVKRLAAAAGRAEQRSALEAAVAEMSKARRQQSSKEAKSLAQRQAEQRAAHKVHLDKLRERKEALLLDEHERMSQALNSRLTGGTGLVFAPARGGSSVHPGSAEYSALQKRWMQMTPGIVAGGPSIHAAARKYTSHVPVMLWEQAPLPLAPSRSLPSLPTLPSPQYHTAARQDDVFAVP